MADTGFYVDISDNQERAMQQILHNQVLIRNALIETLEHPTIPALAPPETQTETIRIRAEMLSYRNRRTEVQSLPYRPNAVCSSVVERLYKTFNVALARIHQHRS